MNRNRGPFHTFLILLLLCLGLLQGCASSQITAAGKCYQENIAVKEYFAEINRGGENNPELVKLLRKFPKGADLHNHLPGAVRPEEFIDLGNARGDCFGPDPLVPEMQTLAPAARPGICNSGFKPLQQTTAKERQQLIESLSMYRFNDSENRSIQAGHDHFFATFGRFSTLTGPENFGLMLASLLRQESYEHVNYVETMTSFQTAAVSRLADQLRQKYPDPAVFRENSNFPAMFGFLLKAGITETVAAAQKDIKVYVQTVNSLLACGSASRDPACDVSFSFQATVNRNTALKDGTPDPAKMFTQTVFSFLLANTEPKVVGVNLLSGEDLPVSMLSFPTQMQFFSYLHALFPQVNIALHGGEITPCFVGQNSPALKDHLVGPVRAGAKRLGHAVSFAFLNDLDKTEVAELMTQNKILIEVPFTSNAQILGVSGEEHPFPQMFRNYGISMALTTDDEGVSHADFTSEWLYAVSRYRLTYSEAVRLARSGLQYSFLPGKPLWKDIESALIVDQCAGEVIGSDHYVEPCRTFLANSEKARMQWRHEAELSRFDREHGATLRKYIGN